MADLDAQDQPVTTPHSSTTEEVLATLIDQFKAAESEADKRIKLGEIVFLLSPYFLSSLVSEGAAIITDPNDPKISAAVASYKNELEVVGNLVLTLGQLGELTEIIFATVSGIEHVVYGRKRPLEEADPLILYKGEFSYQVEDMILNGAGITFTFRRTYGNQCITNGRLGFKWDYNYNLWLRLSPDVEVIFRSSGSLVEQTFTRHNKFGQAGFNYYVPDDGEHGVIIENGPDSFTYVTPDGYYYVYNRYSAQPFLYRIRRIEDKHGNFLDFQFDDRLLKYVIVNDPQRIVAFEYDDQDRIILIKDNVTIGEAQGREWRYSYDDFGDLVAVTTPPTDRYRSGLTTCYEYSSSLYSNPIIQHNLIRIIDPAGQLYLENEYGSSEGLLNFNRVIRQRQGGGEWLFEYEDIIEEFDYDYQDIERPAHQTNIIQRNGHFVHHIYNKFGNLLLGEEEILLEGTVQIVKWRYRYNADGNLIGMLSPEGVMTQYYYARDQYLRENRITDEEVRDHALLTMQNRMAFGNLLAVVRRGRRYTFDIMSLDFSRGVWGDFYPDVISGQNRDNGLLLDIIIKLAYEDQFQQILTQSDPRYTETAAPNSALDSARYFQTLTRYEYSGIPQNPNLNLYLEAVEFPDITQADGSNLSNFSKKYTRYDAKGKLQESVDEAGMVTRYEYYELPNNRKNGYLKSVILDPEGLAIRTEHEVNDVGFVISVTNPRGHKTIFDVNPLNQITKVTSSAPFYYQSFLFYDPNSQVQKTIQDIKDENGRSLSGGAEVNTYTYDDQNLLIRNSIGGLDPSTHKTTCNKYNESGKLVATILPKGNRIERSYDYRLLEESYTRGARSADSSTAKTYYDKDGLPTKKIDGRGKVTVFKFDVFNRLERVEDPLGNVILKRYDKSGNIILEGFFEDRKNGKYRLLSRTAFQFDEHNHLVTLSQNLFQNIVEVEKEELIITLTSNLLPGRILMTQYYYDRGGRVTKIVNPKQQTTILSYDAVGRRKSVVDPLGNNVEILYDANDNIIRHDQYELVRDSDGNVLWTNVFSNFFHYDELDRLITTVDNLGNKKRFSYDSRNRLIKIIDQLGNVKHLEYDVYGRKVREILQITGTGLGSRFQNGAADMSFEYDANDNLNSQIDAKGNRLLQSFDSLDRLAIVEYPDSSTTKIKYDENDNVRLIIDNNGLAAGRIIDDLNRTVRIDIDRSNLLPGIVIDGESFEEFTYDGLGRITNDRNDHVDNVRKFDSLGRCYSESITITGPSMQMPSVYTISREFDDMGFPGKITYPSGRIIRYELDGLNRIIKVENMAKGTSYPGSGSFQNQYEIMRIIYRGLLRAKLVFGNDTSMELSYDAEKRPIQAIHSKNNEASYIILQQLHDGVGNVRMKNEVSPRTDEGESYKYNSFYWLTERRGRVNQQFDPTQFEPRRTLQREEDLDLQNRINNEIGPLEQTSRDPTYEYDLVGNRILSRETFEPSRYLSNNLNQYLTVDQTVLGYDLNGNLVNDGKWQFFYDYRNRLVRIRDINRATDIKKFIHDAQGRRVVSIDDTIATISIHDGPNIIEEHLENQLYAQYVHEYAMDSVCQITTEGNEYWYHKDFVGSSRMLTDSAGRISGLYRYLPFGATLEAIGPYNPIRFMNRYFDDKVELYDFRTRMYLPKLGKFAQRDFLHSANAYQFVNSNPLTFVDPLGTEKESTSTADLQGLDLSLFALARQIDRIFTSPQSIKGELLSGPLRLWTFGLPSYKRPGYTFVQTPWLAWADRLPGDEWTNFALASRKMTAEAVRSETAVTSSIVQHRADSTQWRHELPEVWKGWKIPFALSLLSGASTIVSSLVADDKRIKYLGILFGSMEAVGTASYAAGSYGLSRSVVEALITGESQMTTQYNQIKHVAIEVGSKLTRIGGGLGSGLISGYSMYRSFERGNIAQGLTQGTMSVSGVLMALGTIEPLKNLGSLGGRIGLVGIFASSAVSTVELTNQLFEEAASKPAESYSTPWIIQQLMYRQNPNQIRSDWFRRQ